MYINVNGINLYYECIGEGKPIILLHGNSSNTKYMKIIGKKLSEKYKVYFVDRRCCGKSEKNCSLSYEETAKDIYEFITKLNLDNPIILGHSGGGSTLLHLAIKYTDSISKIVLCSAVATKSKLNYPKYFKLLNKLPWYPGKKINDKFLIMNNEMKEISKDELSKIKNKTLIVNAKDEIVPLSEAEYINANINNSRLLILENETHVSYLTKIKWYDKLIEFLEEE